MTRLRQRLARLEKAAYQPLEGGDIRQSLPPADESGPLAGELTAVFGALVKDYRENYNFPQEEAVARAGATHPAHVEHVLRCPPDQVSWFDLDSLAKDDPELARRRWEKIKQAARQELQSGHRAARALEPVSDCWQRAQFLAIRDELAQAWRPRNAQEAQLVEMLAQVQTLLLRWQEILATRTQLADRGCKRATEEGERFKAPRLSEAAAVEEAATMVERLHRMFLRTLKGLQDLRRHSPRLIVQNARQVNVGGQQVNVANP
jgi:hypothetical protein